MDVHIKNGEDLVKLWRTGDFSRKYFQGKTFYYKSDPQNGGFKFTSRKPAGLFTEETGSAAGRKGSNPRFPITRNSRLRFISRSMALFEKSQNLPTTFVLTYDDREVQNPWADFNRFKTNLVKTYDLRQYMAALEVTQRGQYHFHCFVDMPFYNISDIVGAWSSARGYFVNDWAVTGMERIRSQKMAAKYCAKYLGKARSKDHELRKFSNSRNLNGTEFTYVPESILGDMEAYNIKQHEFCETGKVSFSDELKMAFEEENYDEYMQ